jgi:sugar phosphate isomerase/epimerase
MLGNSGAPRWYDCDDGRFRAYLDLLQEVGASAAEVVLHDGDADEFTSRVHVVRQDWAQVISGYRDRGLRLSVHGPLTPEFSPMQWRDQPGETLRRYDSVLRQVAELAEDQGEATLVLHALTDPRSTAAENEQSTAAFLSAIAERSYRYSDKVSLALELRAFRHERPTAAAMTRESVMRVIDLVEYDAVGICWDVAHDLESHIALGQRWTDPPEAFRSRITHLHLHDLGPDDEPHYPPLVGRVPLKQSLEELDHVPRIMEVRWRMAARLGDPWEVLGRSYDVVSSISRS